MKILIAEDDQTSRSVLKAILQKLGHQVVAVEDGQQALATMEADKAPRLAILDWRMPGLDGVEVCRRVKATQAEQPPYLIILTSLHDQKHVSVGLDAGADDYMTKPFEHNELRARITVGERILAIQDSLVRQAEELRTALAQVKTLKGLIPICSYCKRVRDDDNYWHDVEQYVSEHTDSAFSHGLGPPCLEKYYGDE